MERGRVRLSARGGRYDLAREQGATEQEGKARPSSRRGRRDPAGEEGATEDREQRRCDQV